MTDPAEKYRDHLDPNHIVVMEIVAQCYHMLTMVAPHLRQLSEAEIRAHSIGHITHPTLYKDMIYSKSFATQMKMVRAALAFVDEIDAAKAEIP